MCVPEEVGNLSKANISVSHLCGSLQLVAEKQKAGRRILKSLESLSQAAGIPLCPWLGRRDARLYWGIAAPHATLENVHIRPEHLMTSLSPPSSGLRACGRGFTSQLCSPGLQRESRLIRASPELACGGLGNPTRLSKASLRVNISNVSQFSMQAQWFVGISGVPKLSCSPETPAAVPGACHCPWS